MTDPSITISDILNSRLGVKGIMNEMKRARNTRIYFQDKRTRTHRASL